MENKTNEKGLTQISFTVDDVFLQGLNRLADKLNCSKPEVIKMSLGTFAVWVEEQELKNQKS